MQRYDSNEVGTKWNGTKLDHIIQFNYDWMFDDTKPQKKGVGKTSMC